MREPIHTPVSLENRERFFYEELYHDLKTPITILFGYIQLLERMNGLPGQALSYIQETKKSCFRVAKLVRDANDGARLSRGTMLPQFVNADMVSLVSRICDDARMLAGPKRIRIRFDSRVAEKYMAVDRQIMERILLNLLSNAKQFSPEEGVIEVLLWESAEYVHVAVRDEGPGISGDLARRLFARGAGETGRGTHSGLGLYIVRELAALLGGEVYLTGRSPGTEIEIRLPVFLTDNAADEPPMDDFFNENMIQMELAF